MKDQILRPYGMYIDGRLEMGLEVEIKDGKIVRIGRQSRPPDSYLLSPAFVNAHSHLEYRGMQDKLSEPDYWPWIRALTELKRQESPQEVTAACQLAAKENRATGVGWIGEHTDRLGSAEALKQNHIGGVLFQEVITIFESMTVEEKLGLIGGKLKANQSHGLSSFLSPHAYQTVDEQTLINLAIAGDPFSIHVSETPMENQLVSDGSGPLADFWRAAGWTPVARGVSVVQRLHELGLCRAGAQFVHGCALSAADIALMAESGVSLAHCPRSNLRLKCPPAPIRECLDAGIVIGLGLDSPASGGPIDMFAEMRAALATSYERGKPISPEEVWAMTTDRGYRSFGSAMSITENPWQIEVGSSVPLIKIDVPAAANLEDVIEKGDPSLVEWIA